MHINADFRMEIAARNCGFRSIASVGAQIYGFVSSDAHAASGRATVRQAGATEKGKTKPVAII